MFKLARNMTAIMNQDDRVTGWSNATLSSKRKVWREEKAGMRRGPC